MEAGIGKDVFGSYQNYLLQPSFSIVVKDANEKDENSFLEIVQNTLRELVSKGIDKRLAEAAINHREFKLREADFGSIPKGLVYGIQCMDSWLYGEDPTIHLRFESTLEEIRKALTEPLFEQLIEKYLLNNTHCAMVMVKPKPGLAEEKDREVYEMLQAYKAELSELEIDEINNTRELMNKQAPGFTASLESIPMVELSDIELRLKLFP